jgi:hypothetical protein
MQSRWKETPGVPVSGFFGGEKMKNERGRKKKGTSSQVQWRRTREVQNLRRARAPLSLERK